MTACNLAITDPQNTKASWVVVTVLNNITFLHNRGHILQETTIIHLLLPLLNNIIIMDLIIIWKEVLLKLIKR
jgi:hypothetical protein